MLSNNEYIVYNIGNRTCMLCIYTGAPQFPMLIKAGILSSYLLATLISLLMIRLLIDAATDNTTQIGEVT